MGGVTTRPDPSDGPSADDPHFDGAPADDGPRRTRPRGGVAVIVAALLVLALAASLIISVPPAFGGGGRAGDSAAGRGGEAAGLEVPEIAAASQDRAGGPLREDTRTRIDAALEHSSAGSAGVLVLDPATGDRLHAVSPGQALRPASNQKILTHLSLLHHTGPDRRLATTVVTGQDPGSIVLVAGGDTLLAPGAGDPGSVMGRAGIGDLAESTAASLPAQTVERLESGAELELAWDTSLFTGPELNPAWAGGDIEAGQIGPVSPMAFGSHEVPGRPGQHDDDAARSVAESFAQQLEEQLEQRLGERAGREAAVELGGPTDTTADPLRPAGQQEGVTEIARVESAPVQEQAGHMMRASDNRLAEVLGRVAARSAGEDGSIEGGRRAMERAVRSVVGDDPFVGGQIELSDASGMSVDNRVSPDVLGAVLLAAAQDRSGRYAPMIRAFPRAGATGTLSARFDDAQEAEGRAVTRAKTGTLNAVTGLSGQTVRASGRPAVVVVLLDEVADPSAARDSADRIFAAVAGDDG